MEARPTGSGRERSSPNRCDQCRGQARHLCLLVNQSLNKRDGDVQVDLPGGSGRPCPVVRSVSAGTDLMLAFIASVAGEDAAGKVQFAAEYYPSPIKYGGFENHPEAPAYVRAT